MSAMDSCMGWAGRNQSWPQMPSARCRQNSENLEMKNMPGLHCPSITSQQAVLNLATKYYFLSNFVHADVFSMTCPLTPCSHRQGLQDNESSFPCRNVLAMTKPYFSQRGNISVCASMQDFSITGKHFLRRQLSWGANKTACVMLFLAFGNHGELLAQSACTAGFQAQVTCFCVPDP